MIDDCRFCTVPEPDRVLARTENLFVMLSLGPIVPGYCLVITRQHHPCAASVVGDELVTVLEAVRRSLVQAYGSALVFEHGRSGSCLPGAHGEHHCHHAHVHLCPSTAPLAGQLTQDMETRVMTWETLGEWYAETGTPYVMVERGPGELLVAAPEAVPRQYLRTRLAELHGAPELADYVTFQGWDDIRAARDVVGPILREELSAAGVALDPMGSLDGP